MNTNPAQDAVAMQWPAQSSAVLVALRLWGWPSKCFLPPLALRSVMGRSKLKSGPLLHRKGSVLVEDVVDVVVVVVVLADEVLLVEVLVAVLVDVVVVVLLLDDVRDGVSVDVLVLVLDVLHAPALLRWYVAAVGLGRSCSPAPPPRTPAARKSTQLVSEGSTTNSGSGRFVSNAKPLQIAFLHMQPQSRREHAGMRAAGTSTGTQTACAAGACGGQRGRARRGQTNGRISTRGPHDSSCSASTFVRTTSSVGARPACVCCSYAPLLQRARAHLDMFKT